MNSDNITIRPATQDDVDAVTELWRGMAEQHRRYDSSVWCWSDDAPINWKRDLGERIGKEGFITLVAVDDGEVVGFVRGCVNENPAIFKVRKAGEIWDIYVRDDCRGRGLGRRLMQAAERAFADAGAEDMKFHVALKNPDAIAFYQHLGYEPVMYRMYKRLD